LSIFFTTPESSLLALAVAPVPLEDALAVAPVPLEAAGLVEVWLELEGVWLIEESPDFWVCVGLEVVAVDLSVVEVCCSARAVVTPTNPAAAMPMRNVFISILLGWTDKLARQLRHASDGRSPRAAGRASAQSP